MPGNENGLDPQSGQDEEIPKSGPLGDVIPDGDDPDPRTRGGKPQEGVEDRPNVSIVTPADYPAQDRADSQPV